MMNYYLPLKGIASMHCSANTDMNGENTAIFFGLSGTGKTTLSTDPKRLLIGDDEHGWDDKGVFNFEGGCYAKVINLDKESEPDIYRAIKRNALLENVTVDENGVLDFADGSVTENTRVSYPINHIEKIAHKAYFGENAEEKEEAPPPIDVSGQYAVVVRPARLSMESVKPSETDLKKWLSSQNISEEEKSRYFEQWQKTYEETIRIIDEGDRNGTVTYRIELGPKGKQYCKFLNEENFITREQIRNHAELLPPYVFGCDCRLMPKLPWENPGKSGWKAVVPDNGVYHVPDWRQFA